ncbi:transposase [Cupriavidus basilensis]|uniref:transposase n=1 Tax=Cupriavidus basilensis TaxID=68895 RepID=UPI003D33AFE4
MSGGRAQGKKVLTCVAVEIIEPEGFGRCRMMPVANASAESLLAFVSANVEVGPTVLTDGWQAYRGLEKRGYIHDRRSQRAASTRGENPALLPGVHRIASLAKRRLLGTHQGAVDATHLPSYLTNLCSASTTGAHVAAECCSTESWNSPSPIIQCDTRIWRGQKDPKPADPPGLSGCRLARRAARLV